MRGFLRVLLIICIVLAGSIVLVIAEHIAAERGMVFGALPSIVIAVPFLYLASKFVIPRQKDDEKMTDAEKLERLEAIAANPKVSERLRVEASSRAGKLRNTIDGSKT